MTVQAIKSVSSVVMIMYIQCTHDRVKNNCSKITQKKCV